MDRLTALFLKLRERVGLALGSQSVLLVGTFLLAGVVVAAIFSGTGRSGSTGAVPAAVQALARQGDPQAVAVAMPGLQPFVAAKPLQFAGRVTQVLSVGSDVGWGQVHIWINDGSGTLREISLAPQSYLDQIGCPAFDNVRVSGIGFLFDPGRPDAELYARDILVAGTTCRLRDDEGLALWMNLAQ